MKRVLVFSAAIAALVILGWTSGAFRKPSVSQAAGAPAGPQPRLEIPENNFDFGVIEVGQTGRRTFTFRNVGQADLTLKLRDTTCKCTLAKLEKTVVPPGGETKVELEWTASEPQEQFYQGAKFETNDPEQRRVDVRIEGHIRNRLGIWPQLTFFTEVPRNSKRTLHVQLYSQFYDDLKIISTKSTLPGAAVRLVDAPPTAGALPFEASFVRGLELEYAAGSTPGPFTGVISIEYEARDRDGRWNRGIYDLEFGGETSGDFSLAGRSVAGQLLNLGTFLQKEGAKAQAYLHYRGEAKDLQLSVAKVEPAFAKVQIGEPQKLSPTMTRFPIEVSVPADSPLVNLSSASAGGLGSVVLNTTNPDQPQVKFQLSLVILP